MRLLFVLLPIVGFATSIPQRNIYLEQNERPGNLQAYVKFSPTDIRNLKTKGYALPVATAAPNIITTYRSHHDNSPSQTIRRPSQYEDEENYPQLNSIQVQQRAQQRQENRKPSSNKKEVSSQIIFSTNFINFMVCNF